MRKALEEADVVINVADADDVPLTEVILDVLTKSTKIPILIHTRYVYFAFMYRTSREMTRHIAGLASSLLGLPAPSM